MDISSVYVIGQERGPVKIGISRDPQRRLVALQTGGSTKMRLLHAVPLPLREAEKVEGHAHWLLDDACALGEWFRVTGKQARAAVADAILAVRDGHAQRARGKVGRPKINHEQTPARFPAGTLKRIDAALAGGEARSDFIRDAVERELKRRKGPKA